MKYTTTCTVKNGIREKNKNQFQLVHLHSKHFTDVDVYVADVHYVFFLFCCSNWRCLLFTQFTYILDVGFIFSWFFFSFLTLISLSFFYLPIKNQINSFFSSILWCQSNFQIVDKNETKLETQTKNDEVMNVIHRDRHTEMRSRKWFLKLKTNRLNAFHSPLFWMFIFFIRFEI